MPPENIVLAGFPGSLFNQTRVYDPVFEKRISILEADFDILTDFVMRFQLGAWPPPVTAAAPATGGEDAPASCQ
jgi:hypothetical protein